MNMSEEIGVKEDQTDLEHYLHTEEFWVNMGPQHPSTHGVLRLELKMDGEIIKDCQPHIGYLHRGMEKMAEFRTYKQYLPMTDRIEYVSAMTNNLVYCLAIEDLIDVEIPERAEYIRVMVSELNRIASHLIYLGVLSLDIGALTPFLYCFREREIILDLLEMLSGQRMTFNYIRIGGVAFDLMGAVNPEAPENFLGMKFEGKGEGIDFLTLADKFVDIFPGKVREYEDILTHNEIFLERMSGIGHLPKDIALSYGVTGPNLRASGFQYDIREDDPYSVYDEVYEGTGIEVPTQEMGDNWSRYKLRIQEMLDSCEMVKWILNNIPEGEIMGKVPKRLKVEGETYRRIESPRGEIGMYLVGDGTDKPERLKIRGPSFSNLSVLPYLARDVKIADLVSIFASIDVILPDCDR